MQPPGGGPAFLLAQVGAHAADQFARRLSRLKLLPRHAGALRILAADEGLTQRELGRRLGVLPSGLVALVDELEARGLVMRGQAPDDRRSHALRLTEKGRRTLGEIGRVAREHQDALCAALRPAEREVLAGLLARIAGEQGLTPLVHPGFRRL